MFHILAKEQQYATNLQFAVSRFVSALIERKDLITASEHRMLFQNSEEVNTLNMLCFCSNIQMVAYNNASNRGALIKIRKSFLTDPAHYGRYS